MASVLSQATPAAASALVAAASFNALANNTCKLGATVTPGSNPPRLTKPVLTAKYAANIAAGKTVAQCWFIEAVDGTNYAQDGASSDGTTNAPVRAPDFIFVWPNAASQLGPYVLQSIPAVVARPSNLFKVLIQNTSGQAHTSSATDSKLDESTQNDYAS